MKNLIYQYWDGPTKSGTIAGSKNMRKYADKIKADYIFEDNPKWKTDLGPYSPHYGQFKIFFDDKFDSYDNILFVDSDVFTVNDLDEDIFKNFNSDIGICTEEYQMILRLKNENDQINNKLDELWAKVIKEKFLVDMPRNDKGLLKIYNSGVVLYSRNGINKIKNNFVNFKEYVDYIRLKGLTSFYTCDQLYLHMMMFFCNLNIKEMGNDWNSFIHYIGNPKENPRPVNDMRDKDTKFVHIQLRCADDFDEEKLWRITNLPQQKWDL